MAKIEPLLVWRERLKKSQTQMAHYLRVTTATYVQWETGRRSPPAVAVRLFEVLQEIERAAPEYHAKLTVNPPQGKPGRPPARYTAPLPEWMA